MWQLKIVYLGCNFALGYGYCMLSERVFPQDKGFFMIAEQRSRMLDGLVWAKFRVFSFAVRKI